LRGHGDSDATFTRYGDEATATDITALIDELGRPAVIVGNSLAAGAGVIAAAEHPESVTGLLLIGPFVRNPTVSPLLQWLLRVMTAPAWAATVWRSYMPKLYAGAKPADFEQYRQAVTESLRRREYARAFSQTVRGADHAPAEASLERVTAPTLVVMGTLDPDFPDPAAEARWIAERLTASVVMVDDAGHYPHAQQPEQTTAAILEFLATVTADA
ncbi:MAG: alpha/beta fold hydrolase, partial [Microcella sp.]